MEYLFSYGTLSEEKTQLAVIGRVAQTRRDSLSGYGLEIISIDGTSYYRALISKGKTISGVYFAVTKDELLHIDEYEGNFYTRVQLTLDSGARAWVYVQPAS